jgi:gluconolactonase
MEARGVPYTGQDKRRIQPIRTDTLETSSKLGEDLRDWLRVCRAGNEGERVERAGDDARSGGRDGLVAAGLLEPGAALEQLATGFVFTEGPVWDAREECLLFSDIGGNARWRWDSRSGVSESRRPSNKGNGMTRDAEGNLVICQYDPVAVVRERPGGEREVLASHYQGKELNSPNDVVVARDGSVYFTDPSYGRSGGHASEGSRPRDLDYQGVYRVSTDGEVSLVVSPGEFEMPNGLCFGLEESLLYIDDTPRGEVKVFDVDSSGGLGNGRVFAELKDPSRPGVPDGLKCDERGNLWVTGPGGIWVFGPRGEKLGFLEMPEVTANLNWGGPGWSELYITASTSIYRLGTSVSGRRSSYMAS